MRSRGPAAVVNARSLRLEHLTYRIAERAILQDISLEVTRGAHLQRVLRLGQIEDGDVRRTHRA